jgi:hypothetical protein
VLIENVSVAFILLLARWFKRLVACQLSGQARAAEPSGWYGWPLGPLRCTGSFAYRNEERVLHTTLILKYLAENILDEASPGLARRIKVVNQGSLTLAELGDLQRENFTKVRDRGTRKTKKRTKRQAKASGALYVKDANCLIKRCHKGIHESHIPRGGRAGATRNPNRGFKTTVLFSILREIGEPCT